MTTSPVPAMAAPLASAAATFGVEEEFLLVDAVGGAPVPRAERVLEHARNAPSRGCRAAYKNELLSSQVEAASTVCTGLPELTEQLLGARRALAAAADHAGARLLPSGTPVVPGERVAATRGPRFHRIMEAYADVVADYQVCGCHVHVGVPDREAAVAVVNRLRPWLPTLLALSANSPFRQGRDTGYASWRMVEQGRFPGSGAAPYFASAAAYEDELTRLVDAGVLVDPQMSFWLARPSLRFRTVEFRTADAAATAGEALLQAALSRALVRTALDGLSAGRAAPPVRGQVAAAALWSAARHGLRGPGVHPWRETRVPALSLVQELVDEVRPALEEAGDLVFVREQLAWTTRHGTGAERQRAAVARSAAGSAGSAGAAGAAGLTASVRGLTDRLLLEPEHLERPVQEVRGA